QYVVEDAVSAGVDDIIMVTGWHKRTLEDHFDEPYELLARLEASGKMAQAAEVRRIAHLANFSYLRQKGHPGNATPILNAKHLLHDEPFLYLFGDDFFVGTPTRAQQLVAAFAEFDAPILAAIRTSDPDDTRKYGFVGGEAVRPGVVRVREIVEKPGPGKAPSELAIVSGYVLTPTFTRFMSAVTPEPDRELVYVEGLARMIAAGFPVYAMEVRENRYYDCGDKLAYLKANLEIALIRPEYAEELRHYLRGLACDAELSDRLTAAPVGVAAPPGM
ncbi:MAG TPA: sugar phosphate nucleotidyltransferase, partial [Thermomicrobiales bacterium]